MLMNNMKSVPKQTIVITKRNGSRLSIIISLKKARSISVKSLISLNYAKNIYIPERIHLNPERWRCKQTGATAPFV